MRTAIFATALAALGISIAVPLATVAADPEPQSAFAVQAGGPGVVLDQNAFDEGQSAFKITTPRATWYFQKQGGAFSSAVDAAGRDWIGYRPGNGFNGQYRGIGQLTDDWFHPGGTLASTELVSTAPDKVVLRSTANVATGTWVQLVEIYPTFVRSTFTQTGSGPWWFLYEGSPGGDDFVAGGGAATVTRSDGTTSQLRDPWDSDLPQANPWVNFAVPSQGRSIFFAHGSNDGRESNQVMGGAMVVFGFGRTLAGGGGPLTGGPQSFTYGILETSDGATAAQRIGTILASNDSNIDDGGAGLTTPTTSAPTTSTTSTTAPSTSTTSTTAPTTPTTPTTQPSTPSGPQPSGPAGAGFTAVSPTRLLDTRSAGQGPALSAGQVRTLPIAGAAGSPVPAGATAVVLNVTVVAPSRATFVRVWPSGGAQPATSSLNAGAGDSVPNLVTSGLGADGAASMVVSDGTADLVVDVVGYYSAATTTGGYVPLNPRRALDTRTAGGAVPAGGTVELDVSAALGIPAANIAGVALNVTATAPTQGGYLSLSPSGAARPYVSNLNFASGQTVANAVVVGTDPATGKVTIFNAAGSTQVVVDVVGWYSTGSSGARFHATSPARAFDTRTAGGPVAGGTKVDGTVRSTALGVDPAATAVVANITVTEPTAAAYITAWPAGEDQPYASMQNTVPGMTRANMAMLKVGADGKISVFNSTGSVHVVADVSGWFG